MTAYLILSGLILGLALTASAGDPTPPSRGGDQSKEGATVQVRLLDDKGNLGPKTTVPRVVKTDAQWRKQLTDEQYQIARGKGTEPPFCGAFYDARKPGVYYCVCSDLPLFTSETKYHSGTGWPSFFAPIAAENVVEQPDHSHRMDRTEVLCARCGAHLGHVFDDGPRPSGLRFCMNSASLTFKEDKKFKDGTAEK